MPYRFATAVRDYSDYASGRVFYSAPGHPALPIRLASEVFQRCLAARGGTGPAVLYDPCCGEAYHLSTLAYLHWQQIGTIVASDVDAEALALAGRNLALLTPAGMDRRIAQIEEMLAAYEKPSHAQALSSARRLRQHLQQCFQARPIPTRLFQADATAAEDIVKALVGQTVDVVLSDVPYGWHSAWQAAAEGPAPVWRMLEALRPALAPGAVVAIVSDKGQKIAHESYARLERSRLGRRQIVLLKPS